MKVPKLSRKALNDPLEKGIEAKVCAYAKRQYGVLTRKFSSPNHRSVPDQLLFWPSGVLTLIEFKRKGKKPTDAQWREINKLRDKGFRVDVVDNIEEGKALVDAIAESGSWLS